MTPLVIYDFAPNPSEFPIYEENFILFSISDVRHVALIFYENQSTKTNLPHRKVKWGGGGVVTYRGGQTPWLIGRPGDSDSISDQWSKVQNIAIFRKKFWNGVNQNIDQSADIWSKPSKDRNFLRKKLKDLNLDLEFLRHPRNECRNFLGEGGNE
jgi:hypothetical protein